MSREFFEATLQWWHRVTLARARHDQAAPHPDCDDAASSNGCLPVGALTGDEESDTEDAFAFDPHPPDC